LKQENKLSRAIGEAEEQVSRITEYYEKFKEETEGVRDPGEKMLRKRFSARTLEDKELGRWQKVLFKKGLMLEFLKAQDGRIAEDKKLELIERIYEAYADALLEGGNVLEGEKRMLNEGIASFNNAIYSELIQADTAASSPVEETDRFLGFKAEIVIDVMKAWMDPMVEKYGFSKKTIDWLAGAFLKEWNAFYPHVEGIGPARKALGVIFENSDNRYDRHLRLAAGFILIGFEGLEKGKQEGATLPVKKSETTVQLEDKWKVAVKEVEKLTIEREELKGRTEKAEKVWHEFLDTRGKDGDMDAEWLDKEIALGNEWVDLMKRENELSEDIERWEEKIAKLDKRLVNLKKESSSPVKKVIVVRDGQYRRELGAYEIRKMDEGFEVIQADSVEHARSISLTEGLFKGTVVIASFDDGKVVEKIISLKSEQTIKEKGPSLPASSPVKKTRLEKEMEMAFEEVQGLVREIKRLREPESEAGRMWDERAAKKRKEAVVDVEEEVDSREKTSDLIRAREHKLSKDLKEWRKEIVRLKDMLSGLKEGSSSPVKTADELKGGAQAEKEKPVGGINLNPSLLDLQIKRDGNGIPLPINLQPIENMHIEGFIPIIINVTPVVNLPLILGLANGEMPFDSADADAPTAPFDLGFVDKYRNKYLRNINA